MSDTTIRVHTAAIAQRWPLRLGLMVALMYYGITALFDDLARALGWDIRFDSVWHTGVVAMVVAVALTLFLRSLSAKLVVPPQQ